MVATQAVNEGSHFSPKNPISQCFGDGKLVLFSILAKFASFCFLDALN